MTHQVQAQVRVRGPDLAEERCHPGRSHRARALLHHVVGRVVQEVARRGADAREEVPDPGGRAGGRRRGPSPRRCRRRLEGGAGITGLLRRFISSSPGSFWRSAAASSSGAVAGGQQPSDQIDELSLRLGAVLEPGRRAPRPSSGRRSRPWSSRRSRRPAIWRRSSLAGTAPPALAAPLGIRSLSANFFEGQSTPRTAWLRSASGSGRGRRPNVGDALEEAPVEIAARRPCRCSSRGRSRRDPSPPLRAAARAGRRLGRSRRRAPPW